MIVNKNGIHIGTISSGVVNFGRTVFSSPKAVSKTITGAGESNTGIKVITNSGFKKYI
ncbi:MULTISPECIES: spore germination protein [Neobacillus]|uniref:Spore germination protein n=1 Tax=Neobacillus rhizophilus TaxID=2833579 RepID=A0A942U854_9BACI|nr:MULTISPECIES: spore germination protein [Neobacillus]MBS4214307.1 spore germination protein [Neobacillus rhizophilus]MBU8915900.1 spore germination protein [Bacillus sp. FJAT-29953]